MKRKENINNEHKTLMLRENTKNRLGQLSMDLGKKSYTQLIEYLLDFYYENKRASLIKEHEERLTQKQIELERVHTEIVNSISKEYDLKVYNTTDYKPCLYMKGSPTGKGRIVIHQQEFNEGLDEFGDPNNCLQYLHFRVNGELIDFDKLLDEMPSKEIIRTSEFFMEGFGIFSPELFKSWQNRLYHACNDDDEGHSAMELYELVYNSQYIYKYDTNEIYYYTMMPFEKSQMKKNKSLFDKDKIRLNIQDIGR